MRCLIAIVGCAASIAAQQICRTAHPQDTLQNGSGDLAPLGVFQSGLAAEARTQLLLRALELPAPGATLVGFEVHSQTDAVLDYTTLDIRVAPTTALALSTNFDANVPAAIPVLQASGLTVTYVAATWTAIMFQAPYVHDGARNLVIEIKKRVTPFGLSTVVMDTPSPPGRPDRPMMIYTAGGIGSNASNASTATTVSDPIVVRLLWRNVPTMRHRSNPGGATGNQYAIGSTVGLTIEGAPGSLYLSTMAHALLPLPIVVPGISGQLRAFDGFDHIGNLGPAGVAANSVAIPNNPALVGVRGYFQAAVVDAGSGSAQLTNAHDLVVNP